MYVHGFDTLAGPGIAGAVADERHYSCPVARSSQPWIIRLMKWRRIIESGVGRAVDLVARPSAALWDALDFVELEFGAIQRAESEERRKQSDMERQRHGHR